MGTVAPFIPLITSVVSTGLGIASQIQQGQAQATQANYMAQVARNNQIMAEQSARIHEQNARDTELRSLAAEQQKRTSTSQLIGKQRALMASQGGDINDGSAVDIVGDTARAGEFDALVIRDEGNRQKYNHLVQAANARGRATNAGLQTSMYSSQAASTLDRLPFTVGSTLLGGASRATGQARAAGLL